MAIEIIKKRSGEVVPFDKDRIARALEKAYIATIGESDSLVVSDITEAVIASVEAAFADRTPHVEDIQNIVEKAIAERGHFDVARAYIVYRTERERIRAEEQAALQEKIERREISVIKRDGTTAQFNEQDIIDAIRYAAVGYEDRIDIGEIVTQAKQNVYDGISTSEINKAVVMAIKAHIERDPAYSFVAAQFLFSDTYKEILGLTTNVSHFKEAYQKGFASAIDAGIADGRLDKELREFDIDALSRAIDPERDRLFQYLGAQTLWDRYFLRDSKQKLIELPQYFWMRVAMGLAISEAPESRTEWATKFYNTISTLRYVPSTPTLLHAGTDKPQMSSCYLTTVEDDLSHIFKCMGDNAQLSKWSGGIGQDWTNIRATNALIKAINTGSQGVIPFLKIVDATTASINRSGKRRGACAVYLETWHMDIEDFLDLRKNTGDDRRRTHDINTVHWIPDMFMKRVAEDSYWTLFSPEEVPELHHIYGKKFENAYIAYEEKARNGGMRLWKEVRARDLMRKMVTMLFETGHPWFTFKDPSNIRSPQDHAGVIHNSNLCTEITLNTSAEETAVCNIGSINLVTHHTGKNFDWDMLKETATIAIRMLDNVIDKNFYPTIEGQTSNFRHRPIGLGIMGFQDLLYKINLPFDSMESVRFSDELMEFISYHSILSSAHLAKEKGAYESFKGSKWDRGLMPVDTIALLEEERGVPTDTDMTMRLDWDHVRKTIKEHGMRNSNVHAIAPTATISNISGCLPSIEPIYKNIYVKSNFSGEFTVVNQYLIDELKSIDLWTPEMLEKIKYYDGSLSEISEIPHYIRAKYKEVFDIDPIWLLRHAQVRGKWIDQAQSLNIFSRSLSGREVSDVYMNAWKMGIKTTYYLRSLGATAIEKSTIDINKTYNNAPVVGEEIVVAAVVEPVIAEAKPKKEVYVFKDETCESCQ